MSQNLEENNSSGSRKQSKIEEKDQLQEKKLLNQLSQDGILIENDGQKSSDQKPQKQKRGRPAGSKNKTKTSNDNDEDDQDDDDRTGGNNSQGLLQKKVKVDCKELLKKESIRTDWPSDQTLILQIKDLIQEIQSKRYTLQVSDYERIYQLIDLTSLESTDNETKIDLWLKKSLFDPFALNNNLKPAAICVYPNFSAQVSKELKKTGVRTAVVSTNFPTGQTFLSVKTLETRQAVKEGAEEIDMVINRGLWLEGKQKECIEEVYEVKKSCGNSALKVILENCELDNLASIYKISYLSLCAGADFIKTSTGKGAYGAKLDQFAVMCLALRDFMKGKQEQHRGIKAAGGIKDSQTAWQYLLIAERLLGVKVTAEIFRIGASSLANDIIKHTTFGNDKVATTSGY